MDDVDAGSTPRSRCVIAGAGGLIGGALARALSARGHEVIRLVRHAPGAVTERRWDPAGVTLDPATLAGADAVLHLGGVGIAGHRWTGARKRTLVASRVGSTDLLARAVARMTPPPAVFLTASAVGIYGDRGEELLDETSARGSGFLAELAGAWEAAAAPAAAVGVRVAQARLGIVLASHGGALAPLVLASTWGLAGPLGNGRQWWSWVTLDDVVRAFEFALVCGALVGPFNVTAGAVRQLELARTLGRILGRPAFARAPAPVLRLMMGEMADAMLLASQRVRAVALERAGFRIAQPELEPALRSVLGRP